MPPRLAVPVVTISPAEPDAAATMRRPYEGATCGREVSPPLNGLAEPAVPVAEPVVPDGQAGSVGGVANPTADLKALPLIDLKADWSADHLAELQKSDTSISKLHHWLSTRETCPGRDEVMSASPEVKSYVSQWDALAMVDGVIYRKFERREGGVLFYQLLAPKSLRASCLN